MSESMEISSGDVGSVDINDLAPTAPAVRGVGDSDPDPFAGASPLPGLEHLGRAIVDEQGMPSGSPANYEATRGKTGREAEPEAIQGAIDNLDVAGILGQPVIPDEVPQPTPDPDAEGG